MKYATAIYTGGDGINLIEQRRIVAKLIPHLMWRHNGLGLLQAYVKEGDEEETRIHIWHPALEREGIKDSGKLHNHRFILRSTVLHGAIGHTEYELTLDPEGPYRTFPVVHARKALEETGTDDGAVSADQDRYSVRTHRFLFRRGYTYAFPKWRFHGTDMDRLTVTVVTKTEQEDKSARILAPFDSSPVHAFAGPHSTFGDWEQYLMEAQEALMAD